MFYFVVAEMAFGRSVVLHFPSEIHTNHGIFEVAPQLLRALDAEMPYSFSRAVESVSPARLVNIGTISLRALLSSLGMSRFHLPPLISLSVLSLYATFRSKLLTTRSSLFF